MRKFHDDGPNRLKELLDLPDSTGANLYFA